MTNAALQECSATVCHSARSWARLVTPADHTMCQKIVPSGIHTTEVSCSRTLTLTHCSAHVRVGCTAQQPSASQLHLETTSAMTSQAFMMNISDVHAQSFHACAVNSNFFSSCLPYVPPVHSTGCCAPHEPHNTHPRVFGNPAYVCGPATRQRRHIHTHIYASSAVMRLHFDQTFSKGKCNSMTPACMLNTA